MEQRVAQLGYVACGVPNLDEALDFYQRAVRLTVSERRKNVAFLTGNREHHWLRLEDGAPVGTLRIGYRVISDKALEAIHKQLVDAGVRVDEGVTTMAEDRIDNAIRFSDPGGVVVELFTEMAELAVDPVSTGVGLQKLLHAVWAEPDVLRAHRFYQDVLGFRTSDWFERDLVFMHCADGFHHGIAMSDSAQEPWSLKHFCILVDSIDDVMRYQHNAEKIGATIRNTVLRHGPSGSISVYLIDPVLGHAVEYCTGHLQVDDSHRPRTLPAAEWSGDIWKSRLPDVLTEPIGSNGEGWALASASPPKR